MHTGYVVSYVMFVIYIQHTYVHTYIHSIHTSYIHILFLVKLLAESEQHLLEMHNSKEKTENEKEDLNQQVNVLTR